MREARNIYVLLLGTWLAGWISTAPAQSNLPVPLNPVLRAAMNQPFLDDSARITANAEFDPPVVGIGEKSIYRVTFDALQTEVAWPDGISPPPGLQMIPGAQGQVLQAVGGMTKPLMALNFNTRALSPGYYPTPLFFVEVNHQPVLVPQAILTVVSNPPIGHQPARGLILKAATTNVFVGESVTVFTYLPATISNMVEALTPLQFNGGGFVENKNLFQQAVKVVELNGRTAPAYVGESHLTPVTTGQLKMSVQAFTAGSQFNGPVTLTGNTVIPGGPPHYVLVESEPVTFNIRPLPPESGVAGFTGFIGNISLERTQLSTNSLRVGDALRLTVIVQSDTSLARFVPPMPPRLTDWEIYPGSLSVTSPATGSTGKFAATFFYTLIPLTLETHRTPSIPFSVFDREREVYVDRSIPALDVKVIEEALPAGWKPEAWSAGEGEAEAAPVLGQLAESPGKSVASLVPLQMRPWFFIVQLAPAFGLLAVWLWNRQRRFLEAHPEVVRRRRARRDLRREKRALRRAVASGDAVGFVGRAVAALQIAAAPHFPAAPRALVRGDILSLFDETERGGRTGEIIRLLFAQDESVSFAKAGAAAAPLFALQPELERILVRMEERL